MNNSVIDPAIGKPEKRNAKASVGKAVDEKVLVLVVGKVDGEVVITSLDVDHNQDDQTELTDLDLKRKQAAEKVFAENHNALKTGLSALYEVYAGRLYRTSFRTFENYCFVKSDMKRLSDEKLARAEAKYRKAKAEVEDAV